MNREEKALLLTDLCARLPYGVKVETYWEFKDKKEKTFPVVTLTHDMIGFYASDFDWNFRIHYLPYLRPMSSMTMKEQREYIPVGRSMSPDNPSVLADWLNEHHFDYRGLIEKGLALEAPEGMYKTE